MAREPPRETPRTPLTAPSSYYDPVSGKDLPIINGRINGLFDTVEEFEAYQRGATLKPALDGKLVLRGDDYPLSYDADGNIEIPACLDRSYEP